MMGDVHNAGAGSTPGLESSVRDFAKEYMSQYDASHDWSHIERVSALAKRILAAEAATQGPGTLDADAVVLAA